MYDTSFICICRLCRLRNRRINENARLADYTWGTRRFGGRLDVTCSSRSTAIDRVVFRPLCTCDSPPPRNLRLVNTSPAHAYIHRCSASAAATDAAGIHGDGARGHSRVRRRSHTCSRCSALLPRAPGRQHRSYLPAKFRRGSAEKTEKNGAKKKRRDSKESTFQTPPVSAPILSQSRTNVVNTTRAYGAA